jgi:hypothetical protein
MDPDPESDLDPAVFVIDIFGATFTLFFKDKKSKRVTK